MKKTYSDPQNYDHKRSLVREKISKKPSRTVPDQNYTMRQILDKFTRGQPINDMGVYNDYDYDNPDPKQFQEQMEEYLPHPKTLDLVDRQELKEKIENQQKNEKRKKQDRINEQQARSQAAENKIQILENPAGGK